MTDNGLVEKLRAIAGVSRRSDTARLRLVFDDVQNAISSGIARREVHRLLVEQGLKFSLSGFDNALVRIRKERLAKAAAAAPQEVGSQTAEPLTPTGSSIPTASKPTEATPTVGIGEAEDEPIIDPKIKARRDREAHAASVVPAFGHNPLASLLTKGKK